MSGESSNLSSNCDQYTNQNTNQTSSNNNNYSNSTSSNSIIDAIVKYLQTEINDEVFKNSDIHQRVQITEQILNSNNLFLQVQPMRIPKSNDESLKYVHDAEVQYGKEDYDNSLYLYNKSIAFADKTNYPLLYKLYQNRALVLAKMELYKACLHTVKLVIQSCTDASSKRIGEQVEEKCMMFVKKSQSLDDRVKSECQTDIDSLTKLSYEKHPKVPFIINCLKMNDTENYGRGIITEIDLKPGDLIAIEKAYTSILYSSAQYRHCSNCLKENWSLIPCPDCTIVMYCNQKCLQIAWKKFHKHECKISNYLMKIFPSTYLTYFRTPLQTLQLFGGIDQYIEFEEKSQEVDISTFNVFNVNHRDIQYDDDDDNVENFDSKMTVLNYYPVHGLTRDLPESCNWTTDKYLLSAILTLLVYRLFRDIFNITTDHQKRIIEKLIYRHIRASRIYNIPLDVSRGHEVVEYATASYPFASLINHSCAPNITCVANGSSIFIFVLDPIQAGAQLFMTYGRHYLIHDKLVRQQFFKSNFNFSCQCRACTGDYPEVGNLPTHCLPYELNVEPRVLRTDSKLKNLIEVIKSLFQFRVAHFEFYPCQHIGYNEGEIQVHLSYLFRRLFVENNLNS